MEAYIAVTERRAIRQFEQKEIEREILLNVADAGRLAPSAMNQQPLKFLIIDRKRPDVFQSLSFAGQLKDWSPQKDEQPPAYIIICAKKGSPSYQYDAGLAAEAIMIAARAFGLESCPLYVETNEKIKEISGNLMPTLMIALGYPAGESVAEDEQGSLSYYLYSGKFHVPKRKKEDVISFI
jgi:nitroreductase